MVIRDSWNTERIVKAMVEVFKAYMVEKGMWIHVISVSVNLMIPKGSDVETKLVKRVVSTESRNFQDCSC